MPKANDRGIKFIGVGWLGLGALGLVYVLFGLLLLAQGITPGEAAVREGYWGYFLMALALGAIGMFNGFALLLRYPVARLTLAISSWVMLLPALVFVFPLLVLLPSLWLTMLQGGKETFTSYLARGKANSQ